MEAESLNKYKILIYMIKRERTEKQEGSKRIHCPHTCSNETAAEPTCWSSDVESMGGTLPSPNLQGNLPSVAVKVERTGGFCAAAAMGIPGGRSVSEALRWRGGAGCLSFTVCVEGELLPRRRVTVPERRPRRLTSSLSHSWSVKNRENMDLNYQSCLFRNSLAWCFQRNNLRTKLKYTHVPVRFEFGKMFPAFTSHARISVDWGNAFHISQFPHGPSQLEEEKRRLFSSHFIPCRRGIHLAHMERYIPDLLGSLQKTCTNNLGFGFFFFPAAEKYTKTWVQWVKQAAVCSPVLKAPPSLLLIVSGPLFICCYHLFTISRESLQSASTTHTFHVLLTASAKAYS